MFQNEKQKGNVGVLVLVLVIVAVTAGIIGWTLAKKIQVNMGEESKERLLVKEKVESSKETPSEIPANSDIKSGECKKFDLSYPSVEVKEFGVDFFVNKELKEDLIYWYDSSIQTVFFSTKSLMKMDPSCSPEKGGIGSLQRTKNEPELFDSNVTMGKKLGNYWFTFTESQDFCSSDPQTKERIAQFLKELKASLGKDLLCVVKSGSVYID